MSKRLVKVQECNGWLRLYWRENGKARYLSLGLPDSNIARIEAERWAAILESDLISGNFDHTLNKYKSKDKRSDNISPAALLRRFATTKQGVIDAATLNKYRFLADQFEEFFGQIQAGSIDEKRANDFRSWLSKRMQPITVRDRLFIAKAAWVWGLKQNAVTTNPWVSVLEQHKVPPQQRPKPFTVAESRQIIEAFQTHKAFYVYADYVEFLLLTGLRPAEAIGLRWRHVSDNCDRVWIGEIIVRGKTKVVKTGKARTVPLPERLQQKLLKRRGKPDELVMPAPEGGPINDNNFCKRIWKRILEEQEIPYRKPYTTRSTCGSHWLESGENPIIVAEYLGHSPKVLMQHYAGSLRRVAPPDFLGDRLLPDNFPGG